MAIKDIPEGTLLTRVRELLNDAPMTMMEIYGATGVTPDQQYAIKTGKTKLPSVNAIQSLYELLTGKPLEL